jgi:hypothetical protein
VIRPLFALTLLVCCAGLGRLALANPAAPRAADTRRIVGILDVQGPSSDITAAFETGLERRLDAKQYWLVPRANMHDRLRNSTKWTEGCLIGHCLAEVKVQTGAELVLTVALTGTGTSFGYVVTIIRTDTGQVLAQASERCDVCTINEAMTAATVATTRLINDVPGALPDPAADVEAARTLALEPMKQQLAARARHTNHVGLTLTFVGAIAAAAGITAYALSSDRPDFALATAAAGAGLALGGVAILSF